MYATYLYDIMSLTAPCLLTLQPSASLLLLSIARHATRPMRSSFSLQGAFDKSFRTVLTGLTAIYAFVYSCQTGLRSLAGVHLFSQDCPFETCQNGQCRDSDHPDTQELEQASSMADRVS